MTTMNIPEGQANLIYTWYQELTKKPDEFRIMSSFSVVFY